MATTATEPKPITCPFTIVIDSNEGHPFDFQGFRTTAKNNRGAIVLAEGMGSRPLLVETTEKAMWSMGRDAKAGTAGLADYSIEGHEFQIQVELKHSLNDLFGSVGSRRKNFEAEIASLNDRCDYSAVVITGSYASMMNFRESNVRPSTVRGTIRSWQQRYPKVHWMHRATRRESEKLTFEILEMWWRRSK